MTRILHVLDHSLPMHSGYTFRTRAILKAQQALGWQVRGVTGFRHTHEGPMREEADGLTFHRTSGRADGPPGLREWREITAHAKAIEAACEVWRPDILHAHSPALCGQAALRAGKRLGVPVVYEIRAFWEDAAVGNGMGREGSVKYRLTRQLENNVVSRADAVVTICEGLADDLAARGFDRDAITIMPNGVDLALFGAPPPPDMALARELGLAEGDRLLPVIGFIGSFYDYEGLDDLIAAMPELVDRQPEARLLLVGGHRELIRDGKTGVLFTPDDPHACAVALAGLLNRRSQWPTFILAGRKHVETAHDWATNVQRYQVVYQNLLTPQVQRVRKSLVHA